MGSHKLTFDHHHPRMTSLNKHRTSSKFHVKCILENLSSKPEEGGGWRLWMVHSEEDKVKANEMLLQNIQDLNG